VKAYHLFYQETGFTPLSLHVYLEKNIPVAAGLGGGSSDAASMLMALNQLHEAAVPLDQMAAQLGSDVPFFLYGGTCLATGRGEEITPLPPVPPSEVVLLKPKAFGISAASAYQALREENGYVEKETGLYYNDFERVLFPQYPDLAWAKQTLLELECFETLLSGSGPTIFTLLDQPKIQQPKIEQAFPSETWQVIYSNLQSRKE
jgi:4-diphosphocytidyl-2-C-methyl-D-erythritol kinase